MNEQLENMRKLKEIMEKALEEERSAFDYYNWAAKGSFPEEIRDFFIELAGFEEQHMGMLEKRLDLVNEEIFRLEGGEGETFQ